MQLEY